MWRPSLNDPTITMEDVLYGARTVYGEARGEDYMGKKLVAHVIINRWRKKHRGETTIAGVVTEPYQFSTWNSQDPNRGIITRTTVDNSLFRDSLKAFLEALDEPDPTQGAMFYHADYVTPDWAKNHTPVLKHGRHWFYNDVK